MKRLLIVTAFLLTLAGCGGLDEASKNKQAEDFFEETLNLKQQRSCNSDGFVYDTVEAGTACTEIPVAEWECTPAGIEAQLFGKEGAETIQSKLQGFYDDKFEIAQCGESTVQSLRLIFLVLHRKLIEDDQARATAVRFGFLVTDTMIIGGGTEGIPTVPEDTEPDSADDGDTGNTTNTGPTLPDCNLLNGNCNKPRFGDYIALHFVKQGAYDVAASMGDFKGKVFEANSLTPVTPDTNASVRNVVFDGEGKAYAHTDHDIAIVNKDNGKLTMIEVAESVGLSWPKAMAYDTKNNKLLVGGWGDLFSYTPDTNTWVRIADAGGLSDLIAMEYHAANDRIYQVYLPGGGGGEITELVESNTAGAVIQNIAFSVAIPVPETSPQADRAQLKVAGDVLMLILFDGTKNLFYTIDPATGAVTAL